ncbi:MAG: DHHA1 domain-containing protein, partial [Dehalococcoidales bacterium]|nr:DHHA1 domain-containing protein [Dehalococcoidales bacterium]
ALHDGVIALFGEKYGDVVRVLRIGRPPVSAELCGGTHLTATGQIGFFHIISESSIGTGLRRIEAVTGRGAEQYFERLDSERQHMEKLINPQGDSLLVGLEMELAELETNRKYRQATERKYARIIAETVLGQLDPDTIGIRTCQVEQIKGINVVTVHIDSIPSGTLRDISDFLRDKLKSAVIVLGTVYEDRAQFLAVVTPDLVAKGYDAGKIVREVAKVAGGGGGGKAALAQAGGKYKDKLDEALQLVKSLV